MPQVRAEKQLKVRHRASSWRAAIARLDGAYSENTLRSYRADFASFEAWCRKSRLRPLPASPQAVAGFITAVAPNFSPSTLRSKPRRPKQAYGRRPAGAREQ